MPQVFDNIDQSLLPALQGALNLSDRAFFCVDFNFVLLIIFSRCFSGTESIIIFSDGLSSRSMVSGSKVSFCQNSRALLAVLGRKLTPFSHPISSCHSLAFSSDHWPVPSLFSAVGLQEFMIIASAGTNISRVKILIDFIFS